MAAAHKRAHSSFVTAADLVLDEPAEAPLREGRDFSSPQEFAQRTRSCVMTSANRIAGLEARPTVGSETRSRAGPRAMLSQPVGLAVAAAVLREVLWMLWTGSPPGGVPWDEQPAWRAELYEAFLIEWERAAALNADLG